MQQELISALFDRWNGKPILVIGGGPSVGVDLPLLAITPACVISANDHGIHQSRFPVDIFVNCDKMHCFRKIPMEQILRPLGGIIVNRHGWADYRLAEWTMAGNSGLTAIAVAAALGGDPVIVTGIDMWHGGRVYFHKTPEGHVDKVRRVKISTKRRDVQKLKPLAQFTKGANIRPMSGPLCEFFKQYDPAEVLKPGQPIAYRKKLAAIKPIYLQVEQPIRFANQDILKHGQQIALTPAEATDPRFAVHTARTVIR
jgi:hypothetical protein